MDFKTTYSEEAEGFRKEVRDWLNTNVPTDMEFPPETEELDAQTYAFAKELRGKIAAKGWLHPTWPKELGGGGLSLEKRFVLEEEFLRRGVPKVYDLGRLLGAALLAAGTEQQKKKFLTPIAKGEIVVWQGFTEPQAGSDLASLQLRAVKEGDEFILNGQKTFIGDGHHVDYIFTLAVTDTKAPRHQNMSAFMVKADSPGITVTPLKPIALSRKNTIYFEDVRVPFENLIGELNKGWYVANASLQAERGSWGDWFRLSNFFEEFLCYCKETKRNGKPLIDDPCVQELMADLYLDIKTLELLDWRRKWKLVNGLPITYEGSQQSLHTKTLLTKFAAVLLEIAGMPALVADSKWTILKGRVEHFQRASLMTHGAGTPEILKVIIARTIGLPGMRRR